MPSNTTYNPPSIFSFTKSALLFAAQGVSTTITAGQTQNLDLTMTDDCLLTGLEVITNNSVCGDYASLQIIDTTGITGAPAGTILDTAAAHWYVAPTVDQQFDIAYPAKIITGLTLRIVYTSTGGSNVFLAANYKLHKVLI